MHSEGEGTPDLLDQWGPCSSRPAGPLTSLSSPAHPQNVVFATFCLKSWGGCKLLNASSRESCMSKAWADDKGWHERSMGVGKAGAPTPAPRSWNHRALSPLRSVSVRHHRDHSGSWPSPRNPKISTDLLQFSHAYIEATSRSYRSILTVTYTSLSSPAM